MTYKIAATGDFMRLCISRRVTTALAVIFAGVVLSACASPPSAPTYIAAPAETLTAVDEGVSDQPAIPAPDNALILAAPAPAAEAKPAGGLFARLRRDKAEPPAKVETIAPTEGVTSEDAPLNEVLREPETNLALEDAPKQTLTDEEIAALSLVEPEKAETVKRAGLFGFLRNKDAASDPIPVIAAEPEKLGETDTLIADDVSDEVDPPVEIAMATPEPPKRRGLGALFSMRAEAAAPNETTDPGFSVTAPLAFGDVVKVCGARKSDLGVEVARSGGDGTYRLFDTEPNSTLQRSQFLTGFKDGCSRRMTGALALFGSFDVHEAKRYSKTNKTAYSPVDLAYEKVKTRICGVPRGKRCPADKAERLNREVTFVTVYRAFGSSGAWMELFLHKGDLVAYSTRES